MKILMVNKFLYPRGGAESYMLKVAESLQRCGHEVQFFGMYDEQNIVGNALGEYTHNMDFHGSSVERFLYPFKIIYSFEAKKKIGRVLDEFKPDIVHMNNINFQLTPSIIDAVKKRHIPLVQTVHDYQMVCPNHLLYDFENKHVCERCVGKNKLHCISHRCIHGSRVKSILGAIEYYFYKCKGSYRKVDCYICPSYFLEGKLKKNAPRIYEDKTAVLHNFIEKHVPDEGAVSNYNAPYVVFAGRLSAEKGVTLLAECARLLPDVSFVVMGNGPEEHAFDGLKNVTMTGFLTGSELVKNIAFASVIAVPSVCFENCPLSILEAQILGVPSVTMNMGGMAELVRDGVTGVLSEPTPQDFAAAIQKALSDGEALEKMKQNCIAESRTALTLEAYCDEILNVYRRVSCQK